MANTRVSSVYGVNENGEVVATSGTGSSTVKGFIPSNDVAVDDNGRMVIAGLSTFAKDSSGNIIGLSSPDGVLQINGVSNGYFCHYYAPSQNSGATPSTDTQLIDSLGMWNAPVNTFGTNLSVASAWANVGFVSTLDPQAGALDSSIVMPPLSWDWKNGESLLIFWKGIVTPEAGNTGMIGQVNSTALKGPEWRANASGQVQLVGYDGTGGAATFGPSTPNTVGQKPLVAGQEHSWAMAFDPTASINNVKIFVDGELRNQSTLAKIDMLNATNYLRLGTSSASPSASNGLATQTRALVILKGRQNRPLPSTLVNTMRRLHVNSGRLLTSEAW